MISNSSSGLENVELVLFFTGGLSLKEWAETGIIDRELSLYKELSNHVGNITFVTYGDRSDLDYRNETGPIQVICNEGNVPDRVFIRDLFRRAAPNGNRKLIFKSNQIRGAEMAQSVAQRTNAKFVARCGYLLSDFVERARGKRSLRAWQARRLEKRVFRASDLSIVTTPAMQARVSKDYGIDTDRVRVIPNYVDVDLFRPSASNSAKRRVCVVGRLEPQKNIELLISALADTGIDLTIVGDGTLESELRAQAAACNVNVDFVGRLPQREIPSVLHRSAAFVLPSNYEGHPKALLEAMAAGLPVVGSDVSGIRDVIHHGETGLLSGTSAEQLKAAITEVVDNPSLAQKLGHAARQHILESFTVEAVAKRELEIYSELVS